MNDQLKPKVFVCPLDWGWGHAARIIPLIQELQNNNFRITLGLSGSSGDFLRQEFPELPFYELPYHKVYYSTRNSLIQSVLRQIPGLLLSVFKERHALKKILKNHSFDLIISDHRYGIRNRNCFSVFITHQLNVQFPAHLKWTAKLFHFFHHRIIRKFDEVWIPDDRTQIRLAGKMADVPPRMPHTYDIGILSRLNKMKSPGKTYDVLVLLSGPEPQRTILERILCEQLQNTTWQVCLVRGTHGKSDIASNSQITILDYLLSSQLEEILNSSRHVICRAGYSTIMDLVKVGKKALLIPTPGQTEQEYLAEYLKSRGYFYSVSQDALNINRDLPVSDRYLPPKLATGKQLADRVKGVMQQLENHKS